MTAAPLWALLALAAGTAGVGAIGGLGGALLLVPALVLLGIPPQDAAPLGLSSVAAASLAAGGAQLAEGVVHHRLAVITETAATAGALGGALLGALVSAPSLTRFLGIVVLGAAVASLLRRGAPEEPSGVFVADDPGEWPGTLWGVYRTRSGAVPYHAVNVLPALGAMGLAGVVTGLVGVGGGFIKTPAMAQIMDVPVRVAAATTTFTIGITAGAALLVMAAQGRVEPSSAAAVIAGALVGGRAGALVQARLEPEGVRIVLSVLLLAVALVMMIRG